MSEVLTPLFPEFCCGSTAGRPILSPAAASAMAQWEDRGALANVTVTVLLEYYKLRLAELAQLSWELGSESAVDKKRWNTVRAAGGRPV